MLPATVTRMIVPCVAHFDRSNTDEQIQIQFHAEDAGNAEKYQSLRTLY